MKKITPLITVAVIFACILYSCQKDGTLDPKYWPPKDDHGHLQQTKTFSSAVVVDWINLQLQMQKIPLPTGTAGQANDRCQAYCGIALYESVVPGMPSYRSLVGQLTDFPEMPYPEKGRAYHWGAAANAALADINRKLFPSTADANKTAINDLENKWLADFADEAGPSTLQRSVAFGKEVAKRVFEWAATDGSANVNPPYVPPTGDGLWVPTASTPPAGPYTFQRRDLVRGSDDGTELVPPPPFSTRVGSDFWNMVNDVYVNSKNLTNDQKALVDYFKDVPGYAPGGTYVALMAQILEQTNPKLDQAALTYAKVGIAQYDATNVLFTNKYIFNLIRPVTYIQAHIDPAYVTYIPTPNHPEFPSGHSTTGGAALGMLHLIYGEEIRFTLHTYDYLNYPTRSYTGFTQLMKDISTSRLYGGLHYQATLDKSEQQGFKVAQNILSRIRFSR
ncbi:vanadium-dependent haloperoxidase [Pollutibacter soli]|uniref:vanadium-dependent haloperoxidase n=1 Tax=Pollutibacter soli TaxID=3034157 RepID=UPI003013D289